MAVQVEAGLVGLPQSFEQRRAFRQEGHADVVPACGEMKPGLEVRVDHLVVLVLRRFDGELGLHLAVDEDLQLMLSAHAFDLLVAVALEADLHVVIALA